MLSKTGIVLCLYISQLVLCNNIYAQNSWKRLADFPTIRYQAASFAIGNKGYVGTGLTPDSLARDLWEYDPGKDKWTQLAQMPAPPRQGAVGFSINQKGYICSGGSDSVYKLNDLWEYDPGTNIWTRRADIPLEYVPSPGALVGFSIGSKGYVKASFNDPNFYEYDPETDTWTPKANFPGIGKNLQVGFSIGLKGYIGTGFGDYDATSEFWEYDPAEDKWAQKADFPGDIRDGAVGFSIVDYGYIGLGNSGGKYPKDFWRYDPSNDTWTQIDSCGYSAEEAFAFSIGNKGYVGTGIFNNVGEFWEYDSGITSVLNYNGVSINNFQLYQNYPNPFNPTTTIQYEIPKESFVKINVYDVMGREVKELLNEEKPSGRYEVKFNGGDLSSGIYFYVLRAGSFVQTRKLVLLK